MKKITPIEKAPPNKIWHAHRLEGKVRNVGIKPVRKKKAAYI